MFLNPTARLLALLYLSFLCTQCSSGKADPSPAAPEAQLPPATQTGANTFGCLVNGQPYLPHGRVGLGSNLAVLYDPTFDGGDLVVNTYRYASSKGQYLMIGGKNINRKGTYTLGPTNDLRAFFTDDNQPLACYSLDSRHANAFSQGTLTVSRLDAQPGGVIAGTFSFVLAQPGCDTLKVTQGRFDTKW